MKNNFRPKNEVEPSLIDLDQFLVSDDTRTGISTILKRDQYTFNFRFKDFWRYHVILRRFYFNLNQSDKKSDQPGILGPGRPFEVFIMKFSKKWRYEFFYITYDDSSDFNIWQVQKVKETPNMFYLTCYAIRYIENMVKGFVVIQN